MKPNKLSPEVVDLLTPFIQKELNAFYLYRSAANWCKNVGFEIAAEYFAKESEDELSHAKKIENFLVDWNITPTLPLVPKPILEFKGLGEVIDAAYKTEYSLYEDYESVSTKIMSIGDVCVFDFLKQFRDIQVASVAEYSDMLNKLEGVDASDKFKMLVLEKSLF